MSQFTTFYETSSQFRLLRRKTALTAQVFSFLIILHNFYKVSKNLPLCWLGKFDFDFASDVLCRNAADFSFGDPARSTARVASAGSIFAPCSGADTQFESKWSKGKSILLFDLFSSFRSRFKNFCSIVWKSDFFAVFFVAVGRAQCAALFSGESSQNFSPRIRSGIAGVWPHLHVPFRAADADDVSIRLIRSTCYQSINQSTHCSRNASEFQATIFFLNENFFLLIFHFKFGLLKFGIFKFKIFHSKVWIFKFLNFILILGIHLSGKKISLSGHTTLESTRQSRNKARPSCWWSWTIWILPWLNFPKSW